MGSAYMHKAVIGTAGMIVGATLVTVIRIAAVDGAENARARHIAEVGSGHAPSPRVVARRGLDCSSVLVRQAPPVD